MTRFSSLISAALAATSVVALASAANAAVTVRPTITVPVVHPSVPVVHPVVPTIHPVIAAPKPVTPSVHPTIALTHAPVLPATHTPASVSSTHAPVTAPDPNSVPWANVGAATTLDPNVPVPAHTGPAIAAVLNGKPVIKLTEVNGNETTVYFVSRDQKQIVSVISSISAPASQSTTTHVPPTNGATTQPAANSGSQTIFTPVKYPEIKDALGRPMGYINAQGQAVYFNNGQMPQGFTVGPDNTIETYTSTTVSEPPATHVPPQNVATTQPTSQPQQSQPQQPATSKPAASTAPKVTFTPVKYPEIKDAYGAPMGYINAQGQPVYFPNGQMPAGFSIGPNNTIETYIKS